MTTSAPTTASTRRGPLALTDVVVADAFWAPRREIVRTRTIPQQEHQLRTGGQFTALALTWRPGDAGEPHIFWESDVAKWIEAASYSLATHYDAELDAAVDEAIELLGSAQQDDGYLNVYFTVVRPGERFTDLRDAHELYCAGHLIEAGVAHHAATGKTTLLDIVTRYANLIDQVFGPGGVAEGGYDGHQEIELALIKLYRATGERRYLALSKRMIDNRGQQPFYFEVEAERRGTVGYFHSVFPERAEQADRFREYNQSHLPVREQAEAVGHSVRAMYMYAAIADLAEEYDDAELRATGRRLWDDLVGRKLYITGGIGSDPSIEGFGRPYELPDADGYAETCAAIGLVMWAQRMANSTGQGKYIDVLERALYNGVLSGSSDDGTHYFYGNPLASDGSVHRHEWFGVACCPPNFARLLTSLEHYIYTQGENEAVINLYVGGSAQFAFEGVPVRISQSTGYPWGGDVQITVEPETSINFTLALHIPSWASGYSLALNGTNLTTPLVDGFVRVDRRWTAGDKVRLSLPMAPRRLWGHPEVAATSGKVALERGPLVYCAEGTDHNVEVHRLTVLRGAEVRIEHHADLDVESLVIDGLAETAATEELYRSEPPASIPVSIRAIPYFAWANRGQSSMAVWLRDAGTR